MDKKVKQVWYEFWLPLLSDGTGIIDLGEDWEKVAVELYDYKVLMDNASKVYCELSGGKISKTNTKAEDVIAAVFDSINEAHDEQVEYYQQRIHDECEAAHQTGCQTGYELGVADSMRD